ncbi:MAG: glycine zipper 2TM domain-containing protein [Undibacterium sp.]|uniref:glycine zipper 2TM domain-containing protein n=1 Tax=Undibacterium sp. TaxID=1914977 RepID=UPI002725E30D|nr:glycine zipper 2TM domain-containing protein [Undibacterium sp.]MDO8654474.1 glycine zipper 2TM domain-containing protein [Undibacterium sp.]
MKITQLCVTGMVALSTLMPLTFITGQAHAQSYNAVRPTPRIEGFNVDEVRRLSPGVELNFELYGTPGGLATLRIAGATRNLTLVENEAGQYEGTYIISSRDKIAARSPVTANLRVGNQVASEVLNESLQVGVGYHSLRATNGPAPKIERFNVEPAADLGGGNDLRFTVLGTPGGKVDLTINGVKGKILLPEVNSGEYANSYTIKNRDRITPNSRVTANLRMGERVTSATLGKVLQSAAVVTPPVAHVAHICNNCGTVEAVNLIEIRGEGSYLGTIGGGVVGALLGSQVGGGSGRTAAELAGAVGGAYAGRAIEGNSRKSNHFEVVVRLQNGASQTISFANDPGYRIGDQVKINNGVLVRTP